MDFSFALRFSVVQVDALFSSELRYSRCQPRAGADDATVGAIRVAGARESTCAGGNERERQLLPAEAEREQQEK